MQDKPLFSPWLTDRTAGLLLHPSALPSSTGIGGFGKSAYSWVDFLAQAGVGFWQVLPMGPTSYGDSPYQSFSTFAGNPYFIDLDKLVDLGLLKKPELSELKQLGDTKVDFGAQYHLRYPVLQKAFERFEQNPEIVEYGSFDNFCKKHTNWLAPYTLFMALKAHHGGDPWWRWPKELQRYDTAKEHALARALDKQQRTHAFWQYLFWGQWAQLKGYAASRGVKIIGDIPIFVALDSADMWGKPELFLLGPDGKPSHIAGVPPDYFSATGQRWGNPLYDWETHRKTKYRWWLKRIEHMMELYNVVRIDHFRGFYDFWKIPASSPDAMTGQWTQGPAMELFEAIEANLPDAALIAEDLGELHDGVRHFLHQTGLPGMGIFQFAFGGDSHNAYLPHNLVENEIYYSGTHDNDTLMGWFDSAPEHVRGHALDYLGATDETFRDEALRFIWESVAHLAVIPAQDLLGLGTDARFNTPGTMGENWSWRMTQDMFSQLNADELRNQLKLYGRAK